MIAARPDMPPTGVDVAVIGGGPAGALAAREAARGGASVVIIEAKSQVGMPCHCAEWVPALLAREVEIPGSVRRSKAEGLSIRYSGQESRAVVSGFVIDRPTWERGLVAEAVASGARLISATRLIGLKDQGIEISGPFGQMAIQTDLVIGADGALSRTASYLDLNRLAGVSGLQVEVDLKIDLPAGLVAFRPDLFGYLWLFPKGRTANLGLGGEALGEAPLKDLLSQWWAELRVEGLVGASIFRRGGGPIPCQGPRPELVLERNGLTAILTGDAAGLTHPLTGAGIPQAIASGLAAGKAAAGLLGGQSSALADYENDIKTLYQGYLGRGVKKRDQARQIWGEDFEKAVEIYWPLLPKSKKKRRAA